MRTNPFEQLERMFERMSRQFEEATAEWEPEESFGLGALRSFDVDVADREDEFVVTADLPGFEKDDIDVRLSDRTLRIHAKREEATEAEEENYIRRERRQRSTSRSITLPGPVMSDDVDASHTNGVLTVTIPKDTTTAEGRPIEIES